MMYHDNSQLSLITFPMPTYKEPFYDHHYVATYIYNIYVIVIVIYDKAHIQKNNFKFQFACMNGLGFNRNILFYLCFNFTVQIQS